ncbi:MAG: hypothetical protein ACYC63_21395 [Armatimonadota bacterium]
MTQFCLAGFRCQLEPDSGDFVFAHNLTPFIDPAQAAPELILRLSVAPGWRDEHASLSAPVTHCTEAGFEFIRRNGKLTASADFSRCHALVDPSDAAPFASQPWLMLALWGYLTSHRGLFLHGALCDHGGKLILLLGDPQVGKSTLSRLLLTAGGACLTDEYPLVTLDADGFTAHSSPWPGVQGQPRTLAGPLAAIFFLRHAPTNQLQQLDHRSAALRLIRNNRLFRWKPETFPAAMELIDALAAQTTVYDFGFVPNGTAVQALGEVL